VLNDVLGSEPYSMLDPVVESSGVLIGVVASEFHLTLNSVYLMSCMLIDNLGS
jgi:hypothetical protein